MAYEIPANLPDEQHELPTPAPSAPRTPAVHQGVSKARPIRVVSMGDGPHGKLVVCEFPDGWQRSIDLPTQADGYHPLFSDLPEEARAALVRHVAPPVVIGRDGKRTMSRGLSFTTCTVTPRGYTKDFNDFDVPAEEFGDGNITGYRAAGELLQALERGYGPHINVCSILEEVLKARDEDYMGPSRSGAASAFAWTVEEALKFFAKNARHADWINRKIAEADWRRLPRRGPAHPA